MKLMHISDLHIGKKVCEMNLIEDQKYILNKIIETNMTQISGYGNDEYTESAKQKIKIACGKNDIEVELLVGGTQTNKIIISSFLKSYEGVISAKTGHVSVHESGAIENSGHKVLEIPAHEGKINSVELKGLLVKFWADSKQSYYN